MSYLLKSAPLIYDQELASQSRQSRVPGRSFISVLLHRNKTRKQKPKPANSTPQQVPRPVQRPTAPTTRRMAPLPRCPVPSPLQRHNELVSQAGTVRRGVRDIADKMPPCEAKLDLLQSLEVSGMLLGMLEHTNL